MVGGLAWMTTKTRSFVSFLNYVTTVVSCRKVPGVQPSLRELWVEVWILEAASLSHHFQACQRAVAECWAAKPVFFGQLQR